MKKSLSLILLLTVWSSILFSQTNYSRTVNLSWTKSTFDNIHDGEPSIEYMTFEGADFMATRPELSDYILNIPLSKRATIKVDIDVLKSSPISINSKESKDFLKGKSPNISFDILENRGKWYASIAITPVRAINGTYEKLDEFTISVVEKDEPLFTRKRGTRNTSQSVLNSGDIYKIAVPNSGVYRIDGNWLNTEFDIDLSNLNPDKIQVFSNTGGIIDRVIANERNDDLQELPVLMNDGGDGSFDSDDNFSFYAEGADRWEFDVDTRAYEYNKNIYDLNNYVYIKLNGDNGKRISKRTSEGVVEYSTNQFDFLQRYEDERVNLLGAYVNTEGTGKEWYGDYFNTETNRDYTDQFEFDNIAGLGQGIIEMRLAARGESQTTTKLKVGDIEFEKTAFSTNLNDIEADYAKPVLINEVINVSNTTSISVEFVRSSSKDEAWLDYIQLDYRKLISGGKNQFQISDKFSLDHVEASFLLPADINEVWDVTNIHNTEIITKKGDAITYDVIDQLKKFQIVRNNNFLVPAAVEKIENQNVHGIQEADLAIIYFKDFKDAAERLADHRRDFDGYNVKTVDIEHIYNEFGSGRKDPTALRDFAKMLYERDSGFKYLLLIGDGTYDSRLITPNLSDHNFIPVYETDESLDPINGFPTDDYFALLSDTEGSNLKGALDIAIGRIPVTSTESANAVINKIIQYDLNPNSYDDWRLNAAFAADDEDGNLHVEQAERLTNRVTSKDPLYNQNKVYFDAFIQESTPGGDRFPDAASAINTAMQNGTLVLNYMGHGGPKGWAQERVLKANDIETWTNTDNYPVLVTATCSFTGYDDPSITSAGELAMIKEDGGVISLFTTVRAVYASENERLAKAVFDNIFEKENGKALTFGEIMRISKNSNPNPNNILNDRKFALIGDPSQRIALPQHEIVTTQINGKDVTSGEIDTLNALETITISGFVRENNGNKLDQFNGTIKATVFDKKSRLETLGQDTGSDKMPFEMYRNILFKGSATVENGDFEISFVIPKDINYEIGTGRVSFYATDGSTVDAAGYYNDIIIGGSNPNIVSDDEGPAIELFMNDENFVFGGSTDANPTLLANLSDNLGINVSGTSIGHDITAILDGDSQNTFVLNDFYEAKINDYTSGIVRFPFKDLAPGKHELTLKAWDISNNSAEARLEFVVVESDGKSLRNVYNYPNPFTTNTQFQFEHDLVGSDLDVFVDIYSASGKVVRTIYENRFASGYRIADIEWNGRDDFDSSLGRGIYFYRIRVKSPDTGEIRESNFEKLVIL